MTSVIYKVWGVQKMVQKTLKQRRSELTEKVRLARQEFHSVEIKVKYEVRICFPNLKEENWVEYYKLVEADPRYQVAQAKLLALCDAANIMGADLY